MKRIIMCHPLPFQIELGSSAQRRKRHEEEMAKPSPLSSHARMLR